MPFLSNTQEACSLKIRPVKDASEDQENNTGKSESALALKAMGSDPKSETEGTSGPTK